MPRTKVYEITRKQPKVKFHWRKVTIKALVYDALKQLKRADVPKIVDAVVKRGGLELSRQKDRDQQIRFYLWQFKNEGLVREKPDRRQRLQTKTIKAMKPPKKRKRKPELLMPNQGIG